MPIRKFYDLRLRNIFDGFVIMFVKVYWFGGRIMSMYFEEITQETLYIALEIINSNPAYNLLENGNVTRTIADMEKEFLNPQSTSAFIKLDDTYIGIIDYLLENSKDHTPWLGLLIIHSDYQGYGFGVQAFKLYENDMLNRGLICVRIGVIKDNLKAHIFWKSLGFTFFETKIWKNGIEILCYEKQLVQKHPDEARPQEP